MLSHIPERKFLLILLSVLAIAFVLSIGQNIIRYGMHEGYRPMRSVLYLSNSLLLFVPLVPFLLFLAKKWLMKYPTYYWLGAVGLVLGGIGVFFLYSNLGMVALGFYEEFLSEAYARSYFGREAFWHLIVLSLTVGYVWLNRNNPPSLPSLKMISATQGKHKVTLPASMIHWIEADDHYLILHGESRSLLKRETLENMLATLQPDFMRVHRKYLVNKAAVIGFEKHNRSEYLLLKSGEKVKVSRSYAPQVKAWHIGDRERPIHE